MSSRPIVELTNVFKSYGAVDALNGLSLSIEPGEAVALLGPNGAGKSTAIRLMLGLSRPDHGTVRLHDKPPSQAMVRRQIGATPQETGFPENLRVSEIIALVQSHYPSPLSLQRIMSAFDLEAVAHRFANGLSGGQQRRLAVALAFAGGARTVFLDEPTTGLDVLSRRKMWQVVAEFRAEGGTLLFSTHYVEEAEALASRVVLIDNGRLVKSGTVEQIKASVGVKYVQFRAPKCPEIAEVTKMDVDRDVYRLVCRDADQVVRTLVVSNVEFQDLEVRSLSLEEAVLAVFGSTS